MARIYNAGQLTAAPATLYFAAAPSPPPALVGIPPATVTQTGIPQDVPAGIPPQGVPISDVPGAGPSDVSPPAQAKAGVPIGMLLLLAAAIYFVAK